MPRPAFFVDGFTEMRVLQRVCPSAVVRRLNLNGESVKIGAIAKAINLQFQLLNNRCHPIVVMIDREQRVETCNAIIAEMQAAMEAIGLPVDQFHIGVCDRMIENWITADRELIVERFGREIVVNDGDHGKAAIRQLFARDSPYQETVHGVELLVSASAQRIAERSESFRNFIHDFPLQCQWLAG